MIRWLCLIFGCGLLIVPSFLLNYRENHVADSRSVLGIRQTLQGYDLVEVNFRRHETVLTSVDMAPDWYQSSPDGDWILFTTTNYPDSEIYLMQRDGTGLTRLRESFMLIDRPLWSPNRAEFAYVEAHEETLRVFHCNTDGDIIGEYEVEWDGEPWWILKWLDGNTLELINLSKKPSYIIDLPSGVIQSTDRYIDIDQRRFSRISPNEQFNFIFDKYELALTTDWHTVTPRIVWQIETPDLQWRDSPIWSDDSTQLALVSKTEADIVRSAITTNIYVFSSQQLELTQLTSDGRYKYFVINNPGGLTKENPFSFTNHWVLFVSQAHDFAARYYHIVRTDGSQEEISSLIVGRDNNSIYKVRWLAPPPDEPINQNLLALLGGLFILISLLSLRFRRLVL